MWDDRGSNPDEMLDSTLAEAISAPSSIFRNYFEMPLRNLEDSTPSTQKSTQLFPVKRPSHSTTNYLKIPFNSIAPSTVRLATCLLPSDPVMDIQYTFLSVLCVLHDPTSRVPGAAERYTNVYSHMSKKAHKFRSRDIQLFATLVQ